MNWLVTPAPHGGGTSEWDMKEALLSRAEVAGTPSDKGRAITKLIHVITVSVCSREFNIEA